MMDLGLEDGGRRKEYPASVSLERNAEKHELLITMVTL